MSTKEKRYIKEQAYFNAMVDRCGETWWGTKTPAGKRRLQKRTELIFKQIKNNSSLILELGCGTGALTEYAAAESFFRRYLACDISFSALKIAKEKLTNFSKIDFECVNLTYLSYKDNAFDLIIGSSILHHVSLKDTIKEVYRVLKIGGTICFFEPNMANPQVFIERNIRFIGKILQVTKDETAFFKSQISKTLIGAGFDNVEVRPFDFLHPLIPANLIAFTENISEKLEKIPLLKEFSGSLFITATKPCCKIVHSYR